MAIILKANKVNLFVSSVLCVFWYHLPNVLYTLHICNISWLRVKLTSRPILWSFTYSLIKYGSCSVYGHHLSTTPNNVWGNGGIVNLALHKDDCFTSYSGHFNHGTSFPVSPYPKHISHPMALQPQVGKGLFIFEASGSHTRGRTPLDEWSARRRYLYLTKHSTQKWHTSMPSVGFEFTIPGKRSLADPRRRPAATVIGTQKGTENRKVTFLCRQSNHVIRWPANGT
jgi:hypothetical protein